MGMIVQIEDAAATSPAEDPKVFHRLVIGLQQHRYIVVNGCHFQLFGYFHHLFSFTPDQ
jgi:hypothetical protein